MKPFDINKIEKQKNISQSIILFGSGFYGKLAYSALSQKGINIDCFVDENPTQHGKLLYNKVIISFGIFSGTHSIVT